MKKIFIAATKQNDGKTTVCLGLISNLKNRFKNIAFIKPIGQRYLEEEGLKVDEDSVLIEKVCKVRCGLRDMSPVAVERGFTEKYISSPNKKGITAQIKNAFRHISKGHDLTIIEGTGHAGVGSVFDHSNATVAHLLGSRVILISSGGVGRPIDEIILNKALFEKEGVKLTGVIINKVLPEKFEKINQLVRKGLRRKKIDVLGVIPYKPMLSYPTIGQILEETDFVLLAGRECLKNHVSKIIVGAMEVCDAIKYVTDMSLIITPGDREDIIKMALGCHKQGVGNKQTKIAGLILTGGFKPSRGLLSEFASNSIPVLSSSLDTFNVTSLVSDLTVKIRPQDKHKIEEVINLVGDYVNIDMLLERS
jgi:hypothetical protein